MRSWKQQFKIKTGRRKWYSTGTETVWICSALNAYVDTCDVISLSMKLEGNKNMKDGVSGNNYKKKSWEVTDIWACAQKSLSKCPLKDGSLHEQCWDRTASASIQRKNTSFSQTVSRSYRAALESQIISILHDAHLSVVAPARWRSIGCVSRVFFCTPGFWCCWELLSLVSYSWDTTALLQCSIALCDSLQWLSSMSSVSSMSLLSDMIVKAVRPSQLRITPLKVFFFVVKCCSWIAVKSQSSEVLHLLQRGIDTWEVLLRFCTATKPHPLSMDKIHHWLLFQLDIIYPVTKSSPFSCSIFKDTSTQLADLDEHTAHSNECCMLIGDIGH